MEPTFQVLPEDWQKARAKEYIRKYISDDSMGIDHKKIEDWLLEIIRFVKGEVYTYKDIFGTYYPESSLNRDVAEHHLRQIVNFIPLRNKWYALEENLGMTLSIVPILFGIPLLLIQLIIWLIQYFKKEKRNYLIKLSKESLRFIFLFSIVIGIFYLIKEAKNEYATQKIVNFISGRYFHLKSGGIVGLFAFVVSFLGLWGLKIFFNLAYVETCSFIKIIKGFRITLKKIKE